MESHRKKRHDKYGAVGEPDAPVRKCKKKNEKLDTVLKELAELKSSNVELNNELSKARETILSLQTSLNTPRSISSEINSVDFIDDVGPTSTQWQGTKGSAEMTRFMSSVKQMSVSAITVPECKPSCDGDVIGRHDFEIWKDLLIDTMKLAAVVDEATQFTVFKVKAGQRLLDIFRNTKSTPDAPNQDTHPFSNALWRLKTYFGSGSD
ncbi:uncharacterized protein LOC129721027 [Wyeomyia smithii]|uniref:uncharacterized protein LOC129721027 n=1 Tax=Wyeomyia smithii TaxID=174621 RepID=UPI002467FD18|nr:uncharacterized protein LOC129721027 [Wyeomyia smithii]